MLAITLIILIFIVPAYSEEPLEPTLLSILTTLGFTNIAETTIETFPPGVYEAVLYAEFAAQHDTNELSYYATGTSDYVLIFSGPDGGINGYTCPPVNGTFWFTQDCTSTFGLSMYDGYNDHRYYTENTLNPDGQNHSKVYLNLDNPEMYLIGFENLYGLGDRDYNDIVFSLRRIANMYYLDVETDPVGITTIPGSGCYNESDIIQLVAPDFIDDTSCSRYRFEYWDVNGVSQGVGVNLITVLMNLNHNATAHYITQYLLTVTSPYGDPTPSGGWYDEGIPITASVTSPWSGSSGTRYICTGWVGTGSAPASGSTASVDFVINDCTELTWNWKTQYFLTVKVDPIGLAAIPGEGWYDESTNATLTAPTVEGWTFKEWKVDSVAQGSGVKSIPIIMNTPRTAVAYYKIYVGGVSVSVSLPAVNGWVGLNVFLFTTVLATSLLIKGIRKKFN